MQAQQIEHIAIFQKPQSDFISEIFWKHETESFYDYTHDLFLYDFAECVE